MQISEEGLRLIRSFEGYHTRLKDGSCAAYLCPASVWTIGYGCTEGVKPGMVWTAEEAETALRREIAKFEAAVIKSVTVDISQNEFDSMVSLAYNIGAAGFARSTVLRRLNNGDRHGAAQAFEMWKSGGGRVLPGLVSRRKREAALFLKPDAEPDAPAMPQSVAEIKPVSKPAIAVSAAAAATVAPAIVTSLPIPPVPVEITNTVGNAEAWKGMGEAIWHMKDWAISQPVLASGVSISIAAFYIWSKKQAAR